MAIFSYFFFTLVDPFYQYVIFKGDFTADLSGEIYLSALWSKSCAYHYNTLPQGDHT